MITLYKLNNNNKVSWWRIHHTTTAYTVEWGQDHKAMSTTQNSQTTEANLKPSPVEVQVQSLVDHQISRKGYTREVPSTPPALPMLAQEWKNYKEKLVGGRSTLKAWPKIYHQPKLDGIRCIASPMSLYSRTNNEITAVPHITLAMNTLLSQEKWHGVKLDGELYMHGADLQTIQSAVSRKVYDPFIYREIKYHVFDLVDTDLIYEDRLEKITTLIAELNQIWSEYVFPDDMRKHRTASCPVTIVRTESLNKSTDDPTLLLDLQELNNQYRSQGYEGAIIRNPDGMYRLNYRSFDLLKYKDFCDSEFKVVGVEEAKNKCATFVCKTSSGATFKVNPKWPTERKQAALRHIDNYIGRMLTVKYEKLSKDNIPLKPIGVGFRD